MIFPSDETFCSSYNTKRGHKKFSVTVQSRLKFTTIQSFWELNLLSLLVQDTPFSRILHTYFKRQTFRLLFYFVDNCRCDLFLFTYKILQTIACYSNNILQFSAPSIAFIHKSYQYCYVICRSVLLVVLTYLFSLQCRKQMDYVTETGGSR